MNLPNKLTLLRVLLIPEFIAFFYMGADWARLVAAAIFFIACMTDIADGYAARKMNAVTDFGKLMDPIADKLLVLTAFLLLCEEGSMPAVAVIVTVAREMIISGVRILASAGGKVISASFWGKLKTALQDVTVIYMLVLKVALHIIPIDLSGVLIWVTVAVTVISLVDYVIKNSKYINMKA